MQKFQQIIQNFTYKEKHSWSWRLQLLLLVWRKVVICILLHYRKI
jgi:hypothetical protein